MAKKQSRTTLDTLAARARVLDNDSLASVSGGLRNVGGVWGGFGGGVNVADTWTWTEPQEVGELKKKDDE